MSETQDDEAKRRARNRVYLWIATIVFVLANVISVVAFLINANYARTHLIKRPSESSSAQP